MPIVSMPSFLATEATTGAPPVPVPPPIPAAMKTRSASPRMLRISSVLSRAALVPAAALPPAPSPFIYCCPRQIRSDASEREST